MDIELLLTLVAVFGTVALVVGATASAVLGRQSSAPRRMKSLVGGHSARSADSVGRLVDTPDRLTKRLQSFVPRSPKEMSRLQRRLAKAGYLSPRAAIVFAIAELILPVVMFAVILTLLGPARGWMLGMLGAGVGFMTPGLLLERKIKRRRKIIENGLPDALDLLIVCLEAGCGLDQAIVKTSDELALAYPPLADELRLITTETRAGKARMDAFRNFAERTKVDDVRSLVAMLVQTDRFGTSVAQALRTHAQVARTKRRQRAEERAAKIGVKLVFPLVMCLFPAFYVVTLGPAVIQFVRVFFGQMAPR